MVIVLEVAKSFVPGHCTLLKVENTKRLNAVVDVKGIGSYSFEVAPNISVKGLEPVLLCHW